jgi:hypothetical protein
MKNYIIAALVVVLLALGYLYNQKRLDFNELTTLNEASVEQVEFWRDRDGLNNAKITALEARSAEDFLRYKSIDSSIIRLQTAVEDMKKYIKRQGSVTTLSTETNVAAVSETEVIPNEVEPEYPIYRSRFEQRDDNGKVWSYGSVLASKDSTEVEATIINDYVITVGRENQGFLGLGKSKPFAQVKNLNPFSETKDMRTYQVSLPQSKPFGVGIILGYGVGGNGVPSVIAGVGVSWTPIRFKL